MRFISILLDGYSSWEYAVDILSVGNSLTNQQPMSLVYLHPYSILSDSNFVFARIPAHLFQISEIEGIMSKELSEGDILSANSSLIGQLG